MSARVATAAAPFPPSKAGDEHDASGESRLQAWPPPPHDPRERDLVLRVDSWEIRLFGEHKFQYFVRHGLWHAQLWQPEARVSVLTPSRLTCELYEVFPIAAWKARAESYDELAELIEREHRVVLPRRVVWQALECGLVQRVRGRSSAAS